MADQKAIFSLQTDVTKMLVDTIERLDAITESMDPVEAKDVAEIISGMFIGGGVALAYREGVSDEEILKAVNVLINRSREAVSPSS